MNKLAAALSIAAAPVLPAGTANAQSSGASETSVGGTPAPDVTVQGPERLVCRVARRTATRMRSNRVCRTVTQWSEARDASTRDRELAEAADTLDVLGADDISTNDHLDPTGTDSSGSARARAHDTPRGPR